jgi:hypothetical protein
MVNIPTATEVFLLYVKATISYSKTEVRSNVTVPSDCLNGRTRGVRKATTDSIFCHRALENVLAAFLEDRFADYFIIEHLPWLTPKAAGGKPVGFVRTMRIVVFRRPHDEHAKILPQADRRAFRNVYCRLWGKAGRSRNACAERRQRFRQQRGGMV